MNILYSLIIFGPETLHTDFGILWWVCLCVRVLCANILFQWLDSEDIHLFSPQCHIISDEPNLITTHTHARAYIEATAIYEYEGDAIELSVVCVWWAWRGHYLAKPSFGRQCRCACVFQYIHMRRSIHFRTNNSGDADNLHGSFFFAVDHWMILNLHNRHLSQTEAVLLSSNRTSVADSVPSKKYNLL